MAEDNIQHGIDDNPHHDAEKGAALGGIGGAAVGAIAGAAVGPVGAIVGAVVGGLAGAGASGAAVAAVDEADNDNTVTGLGNGATTDINSPSTAEVAEVNQHIGASNTANSTIGSGDIVGNATQHVNPNSTETGAASANAVFPSPSTGHAGISDADVSDMNIDSANVESRDVVPNVSHNNLTSGSDVNQHAGDVNTDRTRSAHDV